MNDLITQFQLKYPTLVKKMKESTHHFDEETLNPFHLEGDVFTHTMMVCLQAQNNNLSRNNKIACLLHDIGKPDCRRSNSETKRVNFYGHEGYSAHLAIDIMKDFGLSNEEIIHNFQLIAMHTEVFKLTQQQLDVRLQNNVQLSKDLFTVSECDRTGRYFSIPDEGNNKKHTGITGRSNTYFKSEVICLIGLPLSGKSTLRKEYPNHSVLSRDDIIEEIGIGENYNEKWNNVDQKEVDKLLNKRKNELIKSEKNVIIDMTNLTRKSRRRNMAGFPSSYKRKAVFCLVGLDDILKRNEKRYLETGKNISHEVIEMMMKRTYPPMKDEFEEIEYRLK